MLSKQEEIGLLFRERWLYDSKKEKYCEERV